MQRILALIVCISVSAPAFAQTSAVEKAEKRLADLLAPGSASTIPAVTSAPKVWQASPAVEDLSPPIPPIAAQRVRLPLPERKPVTPRSTPEAKPLVSYVEQPKVPKQVELPTKPLIKLPAVDVHTPVPIPILAQPQKDRASLGDPSLDASLDAAMKKFTPATRQPIPFTPLNLPDPFENARAGQLRNPPEESATPPVLPLDRPKR